MTKTQKVWLGLFIAIVLVPEIFLQSTTRLIHGVFTLQDIALGHKYTIVLVQAVASLISAGLLFSLRKNFQRKWLCYLLVGFFILWAIVGYLSYDTALHAVVEFRGF